MRILFAFNHPHLPDIVGGLQTTTHDLCLAVQSLGAEVAVLCSAPHGASRTTSDHDLGYLVVRSPQPEQDLPLIAATWSASAIVVQSGHALVPMIASALSCARPVAVYLHNVEPHLLNGNLVAADALLYLANSSFTAARWDALYGLPCNVVAPVVDPQRCIAPATGEKVLYVNPTPIKGVEVMFRLAEACPDIPFLVVESWHLDEGWRQHCQQRAARLGNIEWSRPVSDMRTIFAQAGLLLMPSIWEESFGRTVIEAQLNGLPVLASHRGALPELVGNAGLTLAPHATVEAWAQALRQLRHPVRKAPYVTAAYQQSAAHVAQTPLDVGRLLTLLSLHAPP